VQSKKRGNIYFFPELPSTQDKAWELISNGVPSGSLVIAGIQTAGRGRQGRVWHSPAGSLYYSLILFPVSFRRSNGITLSAARALQLSLRSALGLETRFKLPNDLYFQEKKLAGIILEVKDDKAVLGVGLNVNCRPGSWAGRGSTHPVAGRTAPAAPRSASPATTPPPASRPAWP